MFLTVRRQAMRFIYLIFFGILYVFNFVTDFFRYIGAAVRYIFFRVIGANARTMICGWKAK